jgi:hypothetical protein
MAARTDPDLRVTVVEMDRRCIEASQAIFDELFPPEPGVEPGFYETALAFAYAVMDGIALQGLVPHDHQVAPRVILDALKGIAHTFVLAPTPDSPKEKP